MKQLVLDKVLLSVFGLCVRGIGVGFFLYAMMGSNPATLLQEGFSIVLGMNYGQGALLINCVILVLISIYKKGYTHVSTFLSLFIIGYVAEYTSLTISSYGFPSDFILVKLLFLILGCVFVALGTVIYVEARLGVGPLDVIPEIIVDQFGWNYQNVRLIYDFVLMLLGILMGATIGLGTLLSMLMIGPLIVYFRRHLLITIKISQLDSEIIPMSSY